MKHKYQHGDEFVANPNIMYKNQFIGGKRFYLIVQPHPAKYTTNYLIVPVENPSQTGMKISRDTLDKAFTPLGTNYFNKQRFNYAMDILK